MAEHLTLLAAAAGTTVPAPTWVAVLVVVAAIGAIVWAIRMWLRRGRK